MDVTIRLSSTQKYEDHEEHQSFESLPGKLFLRENGFILRYTQPIEGGSPLSVTMTWDGHMLRMHRKGTPKESDMIFERAEGESVRRAFLYGTPMGMMELGVETVELGVERENGILLIKFKYNLFDNLNLLSLNCISIACNMPQ